MLLADTWGLRRTGGELRMTEAEGEGEGRGGGRADDTGSRRGEEMGVTRGKGACRLP